MSARILGCALTIALFSGCVGPARLAPPAGEALRVSAFTQRGDAQRRASTRMVVAGLEASERGRPIEAVAGFERALQVDPSNPLAYLALARHEVFEGDPARALAFLDKAESTFGRSADGLRATPHLNGLRGAAFAALGRHREAEPLLDEARREARAWGDRQLDAAELR